jgi:hypothetical protein
LNHQAKKPDVVPTREAANKKSDKKVSIYEKAILEKGGEIIDTTQECPFGLPVILIQWRDIKQLRRVTIYIHLLSATKARHLDFAIASCGNYFEFYYQWHEDFLNESKVVGCEKKHISMDEEGLSEAYFQKKNNYRAVSNSIQSGSDYGESGKVSKMVTSLPITCMGDYATVEDGCTLWPFKIQTLLKRNDTDPDDAQQNAGKPEHEYVKVFTCEFIGLHAKEEAKKYLEEVYHSPEKVAVAKGQSSGRARARAPQEDDSDDNTFSNRGAPSTRPRSEEAPMQED